MNITVSSIALSLLAAAAPSLLSAQQPAAAPAQPMSFFVTSVGKGEGASLGGLTGADDHCAALAQAAGTAGRTWRAYLSTQAAAGQPAVNARDRIGTGPWYAKNGQMIAANVADLHGDIQRDRNQINKNNAVNEKGERINGQGDTPNQHDVLTGSDSHGRALLGTAAATTCNNWTSNAAGTAMLGHVDRSGGGNSSWNAAHSSRSCSQPDLVATGGAGLFYCFAI
ncbi:MAG: lectin [Gemmatimonadetes bacterium]|nr:lectin [Gemmatimonadota bacterium]